MGLLTGIGDFGLNAILQATLESQEKTQELRDETEDLKNLSTGSYDEKGDWNVSTNTPTLSANANVGSTWVPGVSGKPQRYIITGAGNLPFTIKGYASGSTIPIGYLIQHPSGQWFYESSETPALANSIKNSSDISKLQKETAIYEEVLITNPGGASVNGGLVDLATNSLTIPNGQVGNSTYISKALSTASYENFTTGKDLIFAAVLLENIAGISTPDRPRFQLNVVRNGSTVFNQGTEFTMERLTGTTVKYTCKYTIQAGDTIITPLFQHQLTTVNSSGNSWKWTWKSLFYFTSRLSSSNTLSEKLGGLQSGIAASNLKSDIYFQIVPSSYSGEGLNGATIDNSLGRITIPTGQTGLSSYVRGIFPMSLFSNWSDMLGKSCTFQWTFLTSNDITDTRTFKVSIAVSRNGSSVNDVGSSSVLNKITSNLYEAKVTYIPQASDTEIRLVVQVTNNVTASSDQYFDLDQFYYTNAAPAGFPSQSTYPISKMLAKVINDIASNAAAISAANQKSDIQIPVSPYTYSGQIANGATLDVVPSKLIVPIGQTGQNSYVRGQFSSSNFPAWSDMIGIPCTFQYIVYTSTDLTNTRTLTVNMSITRGGATVNFVAAGTFTKLTPNIGLASLVYTPQTGDTDLRPYVQFGNNVVATTEQWISLGQFSCIYAIPTGYLNQGTYSVIKQLGKANADIDILKAGGMVVTLTVSPDGTKDFLSPKLANASVLDASPTKWYEIIVYPGIYIETEWIGKPYTRFIGTNNRMSWLKGENPDNATDAVIGNTSTIWLQRSCELHNLRITIKNGRYAIHDEESGGNANSTHKINNCRIEHLGNDAARAWRNANPGSGLSASTVWTSEHPYGCGTGSGVLLELTNVTSIGPNSGFFFHTNKDFSRPNINRLIGCNLVRTGVWGTAINAQALGSGQKDRVELTNCQVVGGYINQTDTPWITEVPALQYADKAEIDFHIRGGNAVGYIDNTRGKALRIRSNNVTGASTVRVSGTAATAIFGNSIERDGAGGLKGYTYGYWDISGILVSLQANVTVNNTIGRRLGDCSTVSKTLTIVVDGGSPINIIFNTNLTSVSNATIIATINAALGSSAVADEFSSSNLYYPQMYDRQMFGKNNTAVGIPRFSAVAYDASIQNIRVCTASDTAADFLGIALEDINPSATGRILTEGVMHYSQLSGISVSTVLFNTAVSLGSSNGTLSLSSVKQIGKGIASDWVYFKGRI